MSPRKSPFEGIEVYHQQRCRQRQGGRCNCTPSYRAQVYDALSGRLIKSRRFKSLANARAWRTEAQQAEKMATLRAGAGPTLRVEAEALIRGMHDGSVRNRSGERYKPKVIRGYEQSLRLHVLPTLGGARLTEINRGDLQKLVDALTLSHSASTVHN